MTGLLIIIAVVVVFGFTPPLIRHFPRKRPLDLEVGKHYINGFNMIVKITVESNPENPYHRLYGVIYQDAQGRTYLPTGKTTNQKKKSRFDLVKQVGVAS